MAEEDEIDVMGDFNLDNLITKTDSVPSELLNCDYTIHPQWLLDKPSPNPSSWYDIDPVSSDLTTERSFDLQDTSEVKDPHICTEHIINDESGWTDKEKSLLMRGIEIFGKNDANLAQFVGSKNPGQVKYYLKNYYSNVQLISNLQEIGRNEELYDVHGVMLGENDIPAAVEEIVDTVNLPKTTINARKRCKKNGNADKISRNSSNKVKKSSVKSVKFKFKSHEAAENIISEVSSDNSLAVSLCNEGEVIKLIKENPDVNSDSELEIDVEDVDDHKNNCGVVNLSPEKDIEVKSRETVHKVEESEKTNSVENHNSIHGEEVLKELNSLVEPTCEVMLDKNTVTDLEKHIHNEFFEGRTTKTPARYLKIRNHILNSWLCSKPNYVTKTSIRQGLKNCGDVNCIGRIHSYLEQIGAINFGCAQTCYVRPLHKVIQPSLPVSKEKVAQNEALKFSRQRNRRKFNNDGEGGRTMMHDESGEVIDTMIVNEEPTVRRFNVKRPSIKLIYCKRYPSEERSKYSVTLNLSELLLMDLHAHSSLTEMMGLIGGTWNSARNVLSISHYEPCDSKASSATHCDMCPVSQAKAADSIHLRGLKIVGWFHSHPTFAPEPSQQDLDTQLLLEQGLGASPCVGIILSPFLTQGALRSSPYRCLVVENTADQYTPFKVDVDVVSNDFDVKRFLRGAKKIFRLYWRQREGVVSFGAQACFQEQNVTYFDKMLSSIKINLAKCKEVNKMTCDELIEGLREIYNERSNFD